MTISRTSGQLSRQSSGVLPDDDVAAHDHEVIGRAKGGRRYLQRGAIVLILIVAALGLAYIRSGSAVVVTQAVVTGMLTGGVLSVTPASTPQLFQLSTNSVSLGNFALRQIKGSGPQMFRNLPWRLQASAGLRWARRRVFSPGR